MEEVAFFVDYEHVVYGAVNSGFKIPTPTELMTKAQKYGRVMIARAFADFSEPMIGRYGDELVTASIDKVHCPSEVRNDRSVKHYTDFQMLDNVYQTTHANLGISTYVLMTGDGHFSPVAAFLKHRLQKTVVVAGLPGKTHHKLLDSASVVDFVELESRRTFTELEIKNLIVFVNSGEQEEKIVLADLDLELLKAQRARWRYYEDRRPELYGVITQRTQER